MQNTMLLFVLPRAGVFFSKDFSYVKNLLPPFLGLWALLAGALAFCLNGEINAAYIALVLSFAFRDHHPRKTQQYWLLSLFMTFFNLLVDGNFNDFDQWANAFEQWTFMWLIASLSYCIFRLWNRPDGI